MIGPEQNIQKIAPQNPGLRFSIWPDLEFWALGWIDIKCVQTILSAGKLVNSHFREHILFGKEKRRISHFWKFWWSCRLLSNGICGSAFLAFTGKPVPSSTSTRRVQTHFLESAWIKQGTSREAFNFNLSSFWIAFRYETCSKMAAKPFVRFRKGKH